MLLLAGVGKKRASPIVLTLDQRQAVERALKGYLAQYDALFQNGSISDCKLFPAGRFKDGEARVVSNPKALTRDAALKMFHELEAIAGVAPVAGRGWYGVRRIAADLAEDIEKDERVLNAITGHRDSVTRRAVYQQAARSSVLQQAARTRDKVRGAADRTFDPAYSAVQH